MNFAIDYSAYFDAILVWLSEFLQKPLAEQFWFVMSRIGWVFFIYPLVKVLIENYAKKKREEYARTLAFTTLAIEPPRNNDQTLVAVEKIFLSLTATYSAVSEKERILEGKFPLPFSFEIVSLDGFIQFIARVPSEYADYLSALFYAQYPECRIFEIEDYAMRIPSHFGEDSNFECWGADLVLTAPQFFPLKTYAQAGGYSGNKGSFDSPYANLLEVMSRLRRGEMLGIQIAVIPTDDAWQKEGLVFAKDLASGKKEKKSSGPLTDFFEWIMHMIFGLLDHAVTGGAGKKGGDTKETQKKELDASTKAKIAAIESKCAKPGYKGCVRVLYTGRKDVFSTKRGVIPLLGCLRQWSGFNSFALGKRTVTVGKGWSKKTKAQRLLQRQKSLIKRYQDRAPSGLDGSYILNIEELTSLFHLPITSVKAPLVTRVSAKTAEPPTSLPTDISDAPGWDSTITLTNSQDIKKENLENIEIKNENTTSNSSQKTKEKGEAPENLPFEPL
jgi:hypothetical protein